MEPIRLEFTLDAREVAEGIFLLPINRAIRWMLAISTALCMAGSILLLIILGTDEEFRSNLSMHADWKLLLVLLAPVAFFLLYRYPQKLFSKHSLVGQAISSEISEAGFQGASALGNSKLKWKAFTQWCEGETVIAAVIEQSCFILPKRVMSDSDLENLRALLTQEIGPKGKSRKPLSKR